MQWFVVRCTGVMFGLLIALSLSVGSAGVVHAEPGPRPTLTPIPPVAEPAPAPPVNEPAAVQQADEPPAPTAKPRKTIVVVVTPIAPVQPVTVGPEAAVQPVQPLTEGANFHVRYVTPGNAAPAAANVTPVIGASNLLSNRMLLVAMIVLDIMLICIVVRRRFAR